MKKKLLLAIPLCLCPLTAAYSSESGGTTPKVALAVHGGAGNASAEDLPKERETRIRAKLAEALEAGYGILTSGGSAVDAVERTIRLLEDSPLFNAGKGAVFTAAGTNELDASIMDGAKMEAGAVAGVTTIKNPIAAARAVMERTEHVLLAGPAANDFAADAGLETVDSSYFFTERRWQALQERIEREKTEESTKSSRASPRSSGAPEPSTHFGTVGAVALDSMGRIAAGTSTGGMTYKRHGRVGDSPIIGAGTYANGECGVSATGHGEYFIRHAVAFDICARMRYLGLSLLEAATSVVNGTLMEVGGDGGVIAIDSDGNTALVFNTRNMARAWIDSNGEPRTAIFRQ